MGAKALKAHCFRESVNPLSGLGYRIHHGGPEVFTAVQAKEQRLGVETELTSLKVSVVSTSQAR